ncbi:MAG: hypothetical protein ACRD8U_08535, partial [Pyrinomonadaceae bacterium]
ITCSALASLSSWIGKSSFCRVESCPLGTLLFIPIRGNQRKYLEGTYAARVRFTDKPVSGPAGDQVVESFYTISPLKAPWDPDYSELDFEYLPNGGWGIDGPTLYATTWETFFPEPNWKKDNVFKTPAAARQDGIRSLRKLSTGRSGISSMANSSWSMVETITLRIRCRLTSISGLSATEW